MKITKARIRDVIYKTLTEYGMARPSLADDLAKEINTILETEQDYEKQLRARTTELLAVGEELAEAARQYLEFSSPLSISELKSAIVKWDAATK